MAVSSLDRGGIQVVAVDAYAGVVLGDGDAGPAFTAADIGDACRRAGTEAGLDLRNGLQPLVAEELLKHGAVDARLPFSGIDTKLVPANATIVPEGLDEQVHRPH